MIRSGPILASLVATGLGLPTLASSTARPRLALKSHNRKVNDPSFILAPERLLLTAEKGSCS
jgi:hypothetical protein